MKKLFLFIFVLPVTIFLDLILYAVTQTCPGCSSFSAWLKTEGALSFPLVIELTQWVERKISTSRLIERNQK